MQTKHPTLLLVLDGWGHREETEHNAIAMAHTPTWDYVWQTYPHTLLSGSGLDVGLPDGQMGNSEVGHMTIGAGRVFYQDLTKINLAIQDQSFFENEILKQALELSNSNNGNAIHILGLLSPGGIHSHEEHFYALIKLAAMHNAKNVYIHAFLDGRDTPPKSAMASIIALENVCTTNGVGSIASITGRYYAMDRDKKYDRTQLTYDLLTLGLTDYTADSALNALEQAYTRGETDEFVKPTKIKIKNYDTTIKDGDIVIFMNFRTDRAKQLSYSLTAADFTGFNRKLLPKLQSFITMTEYAADLKAKIAFPKTAPKNVLGEYLEQHKLTQLRIAETEKYAHVTFFFDGSQECIFNGETQTLVPSPAVATYDLQPEMSAKEVSDKLIAAIASNQYDVIICNLANADMVGHTGNISATIRAIETLDACLAEILESLLTVNGSAIITADHGNAELMYDNNTLQTHTAHTNSLLPFVYVGRKQVNVLQEYGTLSDIAPSLLTLLGLPIPKEMTGKVLLEVCKS